MVTSADVRLGDRCEMRDFAAMVRAHLDHGVAMLRAQIEQRQRNADVVVEIPLRDQTGAHPAQDRPDHFFGRRLPVAAGHGHHRVSEPSALCAGARGQAPATCRGRRPVAHRSAADARPGDHQRRGRLRRREFVAVEAFAPERGKQRARPAGCGYPSRCRRTTRSSPTRRPSPQRARPASVSVNSGSVSIRAAGLNVQAFPSATRGPPCLETLEVTICAGYLLSRGADRSGGRATT